MHLNKLKDLHSNYRATILLLLGVFFFSIILTPSSANFSEDEFDFPLVNQPDLQGPETLCFPLGGESVIGTFSGGGIPAADVYSWKIFGPNNSLLLSISGGALLQTINYTFSIRGVHRVELSVRRGVLVFPLQTLNVLVQDRPTPALKAKYSLCGTDPLNLTAINPSSPNFASYEFIWRDESGNEIGNANNLTVVNSGKYFVIVFVPNSSGKSECVTNLSTEVNNSSDIKVEQSLSSICEDQGITFSTNPSSVGNWYLNKVGESSRTFLTTSESLFIFQNQLNDGFGDYEVTYEVINPDAVDCEILIQNTFTFNPIPDFTIIGSIGSSGCNIPDGGVQIRANTKIDYIIVEGTSVVSPSLEPGDIYTLSGLESGAYNLISFLGNCGNSYASVVPLDNPPTELNFQITDEKGETCTLDGKLNGSFKVNFLNGPIDGFYRVLGEKGAIYKNESFSDKSDLLIDVPGGKFVFELYNQDSCSLPKKEFVEIPGKELVNYSIPGDLFICQSFELTPQTTQALEFELISPSNNSEFRNVNQPFTITEEGTYKIIGRLPNQDDLCPVSQTFQVTLVDPVEFEVVLNEEDCLGNRTYKAEIYDRDSTSVIFTWYNENDEVVGNNQFLNPTSTGTFKLEVQPANSSSCPIPPKEFEIEDPVLSVDVTLTTTKLCEFGPEAMITLETTFPDAITDIEWRRFDENGDIIELPELKNQTEITTRVGGTYEASVFSIIPDINKNCELGRSSVELDLTPEKVLFDIPQEITICESYNLIPTTNQNLIFFVTTPSGEELEGNSGDSFELIEPGTYTFLAFDSDSPTPFCPEQKEIEVSIVEPVIFEPILFEEDCSGSRIYQASLSNYQANEVEIFWRDANGTIIGGNEFLQLSNPGAYSLEVQPVNSTTCQIEPISFEFEPPVLSLPLALESDPYCPDASLTNIRLDTDFDEVSRIEWWFTDINGTATQLSNFTNLREISVTNEGSYEARIFNSIPCLLGTESVLILKSQDVVRPALEENYLICPRYEIAPVLNPGNFASYEWYYGEQLVSTSPTYKPNLIGNYSLTVTSLEGCSYSTSFTTEEECELRVSFPTALTPSNPDKQFLIYTNYLIDELDVWIFNQWGELIFHCENKNLISEESTCPWDGTYQGRKIPNGAYTIRINYSNTERNINQTTIGSLLVVE
ncbi:MAG TPA: hypothetical protein DEQ87_00760 [Algoriphagus sp.]|jgi:hypothetical protein|uniref:T9SS type B sorting domain-containing protein n=2 Tax=Algoriphagus TaxID=246875 RepID=UPI000C501158|nr:MULTISPECIES: gliding motility-associated C-terminal domain-containing protein [unclassified Algoriphagus]MAL15618.1 hypothetical protein [Algoriphagus sp.]HCB45940.1 hypothetical protein [Algoriphagus sp.]HCD86161.1 hypothetical protein [Algoriphagus sp.]|tara:strand:+ start:450 stop:3956 length:3507 start_codon:yes stop_codon:yes gene_type:complete